MSNSPLLDLIVKVLASLFSRTPELIRQAEQANAQTDTPVVLPAPTVNTGEKPISVSTPVTKPVTPPTAEVTTSPTVYDPLTNTQRKVAQAIIQVFETGRYAAKSYGAISNAAGDSGGLSYGTHQVSLMSGNLYQLVREYHDNGGKYAAELRPYLTPLANKQRSIGNDTKLQGLLRAAASDPIMIAAQDAYFDANFWRPSARDVQVRKFVTPLAYALSFDGHIQGGWGKIAPRVSNKLNEKEWCRVYIKTRRAWLAAGHGIIPKTVYRMDTFQRLVDSGNWNLELPLDAHGVKLTRQMLGV